MLRDEAYIEAMLSTVSIMYCNHVLKKRPPPVNMFSKDSRYRAVLAKTAKLARQIAAVAEVPAGEGSEEDAFL
jgi:hypothetical protein